MIQKHVQPVHVYIWRPPPGFGLLFLMEEAGESITHEWYFLQHPEKGTFFLKRTQVAHQYARLVLVPENEVPPNLIEKVQLLTPPHPV